MISLSIIIVSFNTKEITKKCLLSLKKNFIKYPLEHEIIVVDNNSIDGTVEYLLDFEKQWGNLHVFLSKKNLGFGKGNNLGLEKSRGRYVLYLNSDAIVTDIDFRDLMNLMERQKNIGFIFGNFDNLSFFCFYDSQQISFHLGKNRVIKVYTISLEIPIFINIFCKFNWRNSYYAFK